MSFLGFGPYGNPLCFTTLRVPMSTALLIEELAKNNLALLSNNTAYNSEINRNIVKELHPNKTNRIILVFIFICCLIEFCIFVFQSVNKKRHNKWPLFSYLLAKTSLIALIMFYNDYALDLIVPTVRDTGEKQLINLGIRRFVQFIIHSSIYLFISGIQTCLLISVVSSSLGKPDYFRLFVTLSWFFCLLGSIKELFLYQIEVKTRYYKYIHVAVYFIHSSLIFFYDYFMRKLTALERLSIIIACVLYSLSILSYVLFSTPNFFTKCFYLFVYLGSLSIGFTMWNRFIYSDQSNPR